MGSRFLLHQETKRILHIYKSHISLQSPPPSSHSHPAMEEMESFFHGWVSRQHTLLAQLQSAPRHDPTRLRELLDRVLAHYREYFQKKSQIDVLLLFSPPWLSPYERTFLWITGWRPSLAFSLLRGVRHGNGRQVAELRRETEARERDLSEEMARVQEEMAMPQIIAILHTGGGAHNSDEAVGKVVASLRLLVASADALCARTVNGLVDILSPAEAVDFFIEVVRFRMRVREWGERRGGGRDTLS